MSKTLEEIRKKLASLDRSKNTNFSSNDKLTYAHWNIPEGTSSIQRFLPDANQDNTFFWAEKQVIKLPFPGIKNHDEHKQVIVQVPCIEMWDGANTCPVLNEVRPWWKDKSLEETARKYWVKRTYYMQGFVKQDPMNEVDSPENPIRKFIIGPQLFAIIKAALMDPDMEHSPVDYINGTDFIISKTSKGGYADYGTSKWARKETSITEEMMEAIEKYGLVDLSTYLPKRPTTEQLGIIYDMFQASVDGELYDADAWSKHYKPFGFDSASTDDDASDSADVRKTAKTMPFRAPQVTAPVKATATHVVEDESDVVETPAPVKTETKTEVLSPKEILDRLRNHNRNK